MNAGLPSPEAKIGTCSSNNISSRLREFSSLSPSLGGRTAVGVGMFVVSHQVRHPGAVTVRNLLLKFLKVAFDDRGWQHHVNAERLVTYPLFDPTDIAPQVLIRIRGGILGASAFASTRPQNADTARIGDRRDHVFGMLEGDDLAPRSHIRRRVSSVADRLP